MRTRIIAAFATMTAIWGASFLWIKIAVLDIGPWSLVAWRLAFAVVGLAPIVAWQRPKVPRGTKTWTMIVIVGVLNTAVPWLFISWAEKTIDSALATVLNATVPLFTILIAHFALHDDRMTRWRVLGLLLGFTGVVVLTQRGGGEPEAPAGQALQLVCILAMLASGLSYAVGTVVARRSLRHLPALSQAFYSITVATSLTWLLVPLVTDGLTVPSSTVVWFAVAWLGVLGAGIGAFLFFFVLHQVGPTRSSLITYLIPPIGVILGVIVLGEPLDVFLIVGSLLIVGGLRAVNRR